MGIEKVKNVHYSAVYLFCKVIIFIDNKEKLRRLIKREGGRGACNQNIFLFACGWAYKREGL